MDGSSSITAIATACHEVGHACQFAEGYMPMKVRSALVPVVNFTQGSWFLILFIGVLLNVTGLVDLALIFYAVSVVFHLITLPVDFNASRRALKILKETGTLTTKEEINGARKVLTAAALTYVASALTAIGSFLRLLLIANSRRNRR